MVRVQDCWHAGREQQWGQQQLQQSWPHLPLQGCESVGVVVLLLLQLLLLLLLPQLVG
jgi:hypothetical protein